MQLQDAIHVALITQGYSGNLNDQLLAYYIAGGATGLSIADAQAEFLVAQGATPAHVTDMWFEILVAAGYTGSLSDMLYAFWVTGGSFGGITPGDLANLVRWHKAGGTLYTDSAGTDLVDTNLDPIGYATDESGTGNNLIQSTSSKKPTWESASPVMSFDGGDDLRQAGGAYLNNNATMCFLYNPSVLGRGLWTDYESGLSEYIFILTEGRIGIQGSGALQSIPVNLLATINVYNLVFYQFNTSINTVTAFTYSSGVLTAQAPVVFSEPWPTLLDSVSLGTQYTTAAMTANFLEMFQTTDLLSEASMLAQAQSLETKWGLSL